MERLEKKLKLKSLFTARKGIYSRNCDSKNKVFSKIDGSEMYSCDQKDLIQQYLAEQLTVLGKTLRVYQLPQ